MKKNKFFAILTIFCYAHSLAFGLPSGEQVVSGTADFDRSNPTALTVTTTSDKLITNYQIFDIAAQESVRFIQPSAESIALNRVVTSDVSEIFGSLSANGRIFLINPNGVTFGPHCRIDTPGIVASTLDISDSDFLAGRYNFYNAAGKNGLILNQGGLKISNGGFLTLIAKGIVNEGAISAPLGTVVLATGNKATLSLDDMRDISVVIDEAVGESVTGSDGNTLRAAISNAGSISADGGKILLTSSVLKSVFDHAINNTGIIEAQTLVNNNGAVELVSQSGSIVNQGTISANADEGGKAGTISIVSKDGTTLSSGSVTEAKASGRDGSGGTVYIDSTAGNTTVNEGALIDVSGGLQTGDAGSVEISASGEAAFHGILNGFAQDGYAAGYAVIDPVNAVISGSIGANTTVWATNNITIAGNVFINGNYTLNLFADHKSAALGDWDDGSGMILNPCDFIISSGSGYELARLNLKSGYGIGTFEHPIITSVPILTGQINPNAADGDIIVKPVGKPVAVPYMLAKTNITFDAEQDVTLGFISAPGSIDINSSSGAIINGNTGDLVNIICDTLNIGAATGIGSDNAIKTRINRLAAYNRECGNLRIYNYGQDMTVVDLSSVWGFNSVRNGALNGEVDLRVYPLVHTYTIDGSLADWNVLLSAPGADKKGYLDISLPYGNGYDVEAITEDNTDKYAPSTYVGPGYSGYNTNDFETMYFDNDGQNLYLAITSGLAFSSSLVGDVAIDADRDGVYEYGLKILDSGHAQLWSVTAWKNPSLNTSGPWKISSGSVIADVPFAYSANQNSHYVLEAAIPLSLFQGDLGIGDAVKLNWTLQCGNDFLRLTGDLDPVNATPSLILEAPVYSNLGDVYLYAVKDIIQKANGDVMTLGGNFSGNAGNDYILEDNASIVTGQGTLAIDAGRDIIIGNGFADMADSFDWLQLSGESRGYSLLELGYYYVDTQGTIVRVPFAADPADIRMGSGSGVPITLPAGASDFGFYVKMLESGYIYTNPHFNSDLLEHPQIAYNDTGFSVLWEDIIGLGDRDFNDVMIQFNLLGGSNLALGSYLSSGTDVNLTAHTGKISQGSGRIYGDTLSMSAAQGIGSDDVIDTQVNLVSAVNTQDGAIRVSNIGDLTISDLRVINGYNGITNYALGEDVDIESFSDMLVEAPVESYGDVILTASGDIVHTADGDVLVHNTLPYTISLDDPYSTSHETSEWSRDNTVDVSWRLLREGAPGYSFTGKAGGSYTMAPGSEINTNGGNASITAETDVTLSLVNAGSGDVAVTANNGSIIDGDLSTAPADYDIIAYTIKMSAPHGTIGGPSPDEIDIGYPVKGFSYVFDENAAGVPDGTLDSFTATLDADGNWVFSTTSPVLYDSDKWNFHLLGVTETGEIGPAHLGPFWIDTTAPVLTWGMIDPEPNLYAWNNTDVNVFFTLSDNLSGVDASTRTSPLVFTLEGIGQTQSVTVTDVAGNSATFVSPALNIDKTPPVITAVRDPLPNANGWNNTDVTVSYTASDALSGINAGASDYADDLITTEGFNQSASGTVMDLAGNIAVAVVNNINIDKTPPVITASRDPLPNGNGWNNTDVTVAYMVSDALSGVDAANSDYGNDVVSTEGAGQSTSGMVVDLAGNAATTTVTNINIDKTPPDIAVSNPDNGNTYDSDQTLDYSVTDLLDPHPVTEGPLDGTNYPAGTYEVIIKSTDQAGNTSLKVLRFSIRAPLPSGPIEGPDIVPFRNELPRYIPPYLEQIQPFRINPYINLAGVNNQGLVYFYQPLTSSDTSAFDNFILEEEAYEFIDDNINLKGHDELLPILEDAKKKKNLI